MYLKRLEIQGFKSFGKKTVLEFEPGITAIVGPNGAGKSNVSDSVRWVLGEQSAKLMRGKKSDDVIFAGSDKKTKLGFAEVIATFDNSDHKIPIDSSEVSIGRRIDRSGESEYLLNGNRVRLLDVIDLVLKSNIGTSRYTVIGQGTIDQMILAGPAEIKNLLDEASGVKTYYIKREKTLRRLETTAQNLMRAEDVIREIEPRLKSLRRQAKRQESRAEFETELKILQREWYSNGYHTLAQDIGQRQAKLEAFAAERRRLEESIQAHVRHLEQAEKDSRDSGNSFTALRDELRKLQDQKNKLLENLSFIRGKMESFRTGSSQDAQTLTVEAHAIRRKIEEAKLQIENARTEEGKLSDSAKHLRQQMDALETSLAAMYQAMSRPETVNWKAVGAELKEVEQGFTNFFRLLEQSSSIEDVREQATPLKQRFVSFTTKTLAILEKPGSASVDTEEQLQVLLRQKEQLSRGLQGLEASLSRTKIGREFAQQQLEYLEQQSLHVELELKKSTATNSDTFLEQLLAEEAKVKTGLERLGSEIARVEGRVSAYHKEEEAGRKQLAENERQFRIQQDELGKLRDSESQVAIEKARLDTQLEVLVQEAIQALGPEDFSLITQDQVVGATEGLEEKILKIKHQLDLIGGVDELTIKEYEETASRYSGLTEQVTDLRRSIQDLRQIIEELDEHIRVRFGESFESINEKFEFYFRMLFNGGRGIMHIIYAKDVPGDPQNEHGSGDGQEDGTALEDIPEDSLRPEEKMIEKYAKGSNIIIGIDIKATPPGKKLSSIQALSGGERALTSIALLCAMLACFPSPFVVLDEVDAALDDANTIRFGQILATLAHQTQFVTITHNRETMAQSNTLYGVTMGDDGISKVLSVKFDQAKAYAK